MTPHIYNEHIYDDIDLQPVAVEERTSLPALSEDDKYIYATVQPKSQRKQAVTFDPQIPVTFPLSLSKLEGYVNTCHSNDSRFFITQFMVNICISLLAQ